MSQNITVGEKWPDIKGGMRTFLRNDPDVAALVDRRVFFSAPKDSSRSFPMILVNRIGGSPNNSQVPTDTALLQFDIVGKMSEEQGGGIGPTERIALAVMTAISKIQGHTDLGNDCRAFHARIASKWDSPLPGDNRPRIVMTCVVLAIWAEPD